MKTIKIDDIEYDADALPEAAKVQVTHLRAIDFEIGRLKMQLAIHETARAAYITALKQALENVPPLVRAQAPTAA